MSDQRRAIRVLAELTEFDLPVLSWNVYSRAALSAQPPHNAAGGDDDARLADLHTWAEHLGVAVKVEHLDTYTAHHLTANVDGVRIEIYVHTGVNHRWVSVPRETPVEPGPCGGSAGRSPVVEQGPGGSPAPTGEAAAVDRGEADTAAATTELAQDVYHNCIRAGCSEEFATDMARQAATARLRLGLPLSLGVRDESP